MRTILDDIEERLQKTLEHDLMGWIPSSQAPHDILHQIIQLLAEIEAPDGSPEILIRVSTSQLSIWMGNYSSIILLCKRVTDELRNQQRSEAITNPVIHILADPRLEKDEVLISKPPPVTFADSTVALTIEKDDISPSPDLVTLPLIHITINGKETRAFNKSTINIGRRSENDLILEDQKVSRQHAQIRFTSQGWMIFDLGSRYGTRVNDQQVRQYQLASGDLLTLGDTTLIFSEEGGIVDPQNLSTEPGNGSSDELEIDQSV